MSQSFVWSLVHPAVQALNPHRVWMAAPVNALLLLPVLTVLAYVVRGLGRPGDVRRVLRATAYVFAAAQPLVFFSRRLGSISVVILAVGIGLQCARIVERRRWDSILQRLTATIAAATLGWGLLVPVYHRVQYQRAIASLPETRRDQPNVLLLILDTVGARDMSLYGYERRTTPTLDSLAHHAIVFDRAIAPAPWTLPSHASMFTGWRADSLETRYRVPLGPERRLVSEEFASAGYRTGGFVANVEYAGTGSGLGRGFHKYVDFGPSWRAALSSTATGRFLYTVVNRRRERPLVAGRKSAPRINQQFLEWHQGMRGRPWFAFLNYYDVHDPYVPPRDDERRFLAEGQQPVYDIGDVEPTDAAAIASARALYDAALFSLDRAIGELLHELRRRGDLERTVVVITSDHGEEWGEQGVLMHGNSVYIASLHVPLMIVLPGASPSERRVTHSVGTQRLAATLLALAGLPTANVIGEPLITEWENAGEQSEPAAIVSWVEQAIRQRKSYPASRSALYSVVDDSGQVIIGADTTAYDIWSSAKVLPKLQLGGQGGDYLQRALRRIRGP